jgi:hypothetical protein
MGGLDHGNYAGLSMVVLWSPVIIAENDSGSKDFICQIRSRSPTRSHTVIRRLLTARSRLGTHRHPRHSLGRRALKCARHRPSVDVLGHKRLRDAAPRQNAESPHRRGCGLSCWFGLGAGFRLTRPPRSAPAQERCGSARGNRYSLRPRRCGGARPVGYASRATKWHQLPSPP